MLAIALYQPTYSSQMYKNPNVGASLLAIAALHPTNFAQMYPNPTVGASLLAIRSDAMCLENIITSLHFY